MEKIGKRKRALFLWKQLGRNTEKLGVHFGSLEKKIEVSNFFLFAIFH